MIADWPNLKSPWLRVKPAMINEIVSGKGTINGKWIASKKCGYNFSIYVISDTAGNFTKLIASLQSKKKAATETAQLSKDDFINQIH